MGRQLCDFKCSCSQLHSFSNPREHKEEVWRGRKQGNWLKILLLIKRSLFLSVSKAKKGYKDAEMPSEGLEWGVVPQPSFRDVSNTIKENPGPGGKP